MKYILKILGALMLSVVFWTHAQVPVDELEPRPELEATLEVWGWRAGLEALQAVEPDFKRIYPNIEVVYVARDGPETLLQIQLAVTAGVGFPDISMIQDHHVTRFAEFGVLNDITDEVTAYLPQIRNYKFSRTQVDGRYYAMPWDSVPVAVFYRRDVFEEAGVNPADIQTWEDYYEAARTIKERTGVPMWQQARARNDGRLFEAMLWQQGLGYIDAEGSVILDTEPRIQETLEFIGRFWREDLAADTESWTDAWYRQLAEGGVATIPEEVWLGGLLQDWIAPDAAGQWGVFRLPEWRPGGARAAGAGGSYLAIFEQSQQKEAAWAYIEFHLAREDVQVAIYEASDIFPSLVSTYTDPFFQEPLPYFGGQPIRALFADIAMDIPDEGFYDVFSTDYQEMHDLTVMEIQRFAVGQISAQEALVNAAREIRSRTGRP